MTKAAMLKKLHESLDGRWRPEDIADLILELPGFTESERSMLESAARYAFRRQSWRYTSMLQDFRRPEDMERQTKTAGTLFQGFLVPSKEQCADPVVMEKFIRTAGRKIRKSFGVSDFKVARLNRQQRKVQGLTKMSRRQYNKRFRLLARMEDRVLRLARNLKMRELQQVSKSGMAHRITARDFVSDPLGGAFVAYYTATANRRSIFTAGPQRGAFDEIAAMLFAKAAHSAKTNWGMVAHVYSDPLVLKRLTKKAQGRLVGEWYGVLVDTAAMLESVWKRSHIEKRTMIVHRGDDSSSWNVLAGAWNKSRSHWVNLLHAIGMEKVLDEICPGKVLRLMAADVARWHQVLKGEGSLEPDTKVWDELPLPWEVLTGRVQCGRIHVERVCAKHGVDPVAKGWTGVRAKGEIQSFVATPELVHGVAISSPALAAVIRKAGWFSGKRADLPTEAEGAVVHRDEHGFAIRVTISPPSKRKSKVVTS